MEKDIVKYIRRLIAEALIKQSIKAKQSLPKIQQPSWVLDNPNVEISGNKIKLYHFGTDGGTGYLNPAKFGSHSYTSDVDQWDQPRVMFYVNPKNKEWRVSGEMFTVEYPLDKLYPFNEDPLYFYEECLDEHGMQNLPVDMQIRCIGGKVVDAGFDGIILKWNSTLRVDIFKKVLVKKL